MSAEDNLHNEKRHYSPSATIIESGRLVPLIVILSILCGFACGFAGFAFYQATRAERESRMLQYYLLELDAKVIAAGIKSENESIASKLEEQRK